MIEFGEDHGSAAVAAARLKSLKAKRAQIKSQCTRFRTYVNELDEQNTSVIELRQRLQKINQTWDGFDIQAAIEDLEVNPDDVTGHNEERRSFEEKYFSITSDLETLIERKVGAPHMLSVNQVPRNLLEGTPTMQGSSALNEHLKLPRVNLPTFAGAFEDWMQFRNMFSSMIDQNATLPNIQKMQYLISALKGEAREVISSIEISEENYIEAWNMLKERYDDTSLIIQRHIRALFEMPVIHKENHLLLRRLLDNVLKHLRALKSLKRPTDQWDDLIIYLITSRLDQKTSKAWEILVRREEIPTLKQLTDFLAQHSKALEASVRTAKSSQEKYGQIKGASTHVATMSNKCMYCGKEGHEIYKCKDYLQLEIDKRIKEARSRKLCLNCLKGTSHQARQCTVRPCRKCSKKHNTLLHLEQTSAKGQEFADENADAKDSEKVVATSVSHTSSEQSRQVLLATAMVEVTNFKGDKVLCRALLDSGSQSCFVTSRCIKNLALKQSSGRIPICGLGGMSTQATRRVKIALRSRINSFNVNLNCLIIDQITQAMPLNAIKLDEIKVPKGITLADPEFHKSSEIDLLLGAEIFFDLMCIGRIKISKNQPTWQKTLLGWIASGNVITTNYQQKGTVCGLSINDQLNVNLARFWQIEHDERQNTRTPEERICEGHFARTYKRNPDGRFVVSLPTKEEQMQRLGDSREQAIKRFKNLERRFEKHPQLREEYATFMHEYLELKHMRQIKKDNSRWEIQPQYYLPHHCVIKTASVTTKLRVVFDASSKTTSGLSLNDALMTGPVLQQDLFSILLRFRGFKYAMTADIAKMYRQVFIEDSQVALQRIVWRDKPSEELKTYELLTLTYGTAPASFLATKVIHQLAELEENQFPKGASIARRDFYVDDLITGANSIEEALVIRDQVTTLLLKGGFVLRKWMSNNKDLLKDLPGRTMENSVLELDKHDTAKTLGVKWNRSRDAFQYSIKIARPTSCTKRLMLSSISQIFDPLGLLAPIIVTAKILIQDLWKLQLEWDESLPTDLFSKWQDHMTDMQCLNDFCVRRRILGDDSDAEVQLHGFCDASERAYGACIYAQSVHRNGDAQAYLICAKSRVAPIKTISIPRLELCGAQLLARLMSKVKCALNIEVKSVHYWTDSSIVLHWIKANNKKLPVFVAHRVGEIRELTSVEEWNHVSTKENPADLVSRGSSTKELCSSQLWWNGPKWLESRVRYQSLKLQEIDDNQLEYLNEKVALVATTQVKLDLLDRFSSLQRLIRVIATCIRFAQLCKGKDGVQGSQPLTLEELEYAKECLIRMEQANAFESEIRALRDNKAIPNNSKLRHLNPLLDAKGLLRVGGRLKFAELQYESKHPLVLSHQSKLTELIIVHEHVRHCHAGANATLAAIRQLYWPIRARGLIKNLVHKCVKCFRSRPHTSEQIMGNLPVNRVTPSKPFTNTGVDFCGPIYLREGKRRGAKRIKSYVAVYICMAVKAVHLEVVSDMTTDAFLNSFKRFISRRGRPVNMYSDNGSNFVGAKRELEKCSELFSLEQQKRNITEHAVSEGIKWHFISARAPHFGGLWESAVKSFKNHFYKTVAQAAMTFEEACTLVVQIEAILNSRPLIALS